MSCIVWIVHVDEFYLDCLSWSHNSFDFMLTVDIVDVYINIVVEIHTIRCIILDFTVKWISL